MSTEPYNDTIKEAFRRYHTVARLVRAAMSQENESEYASPLPSAEKVNAIETLLISATYGDPQAIAQLSETYPFMWRLMLKNGIIDPSC